MNAALRDELVAMAEGDQRRWSETVVRVLADVMPIYQFQDRELCERLLPHAQVAADYIERYDMATLEAGR